MEDQKDILPEFEEIINNPFEVIEVPESMVDSVSTQERLERQKSMKMIGQKISYLKNVLDYGENNQTYLLPDSLKNYIRRAEETFIANESKLSDYIGAEPTENLIRKKIPTIKHIDIDERTSTRDEDIIKALIDNFKNTRGNKVSISTSHGATYFNLEAAHEAEEDQSAKIAVIVFDNHTDLYPSEKESESSVPWKGNVFKLLGSDKIVERVMFIGGYNEKRLVIEENNKALTEGKNIIYEQIEIDYLKKNGKTNKPKLLHYLEVVINEYKKSGITNVVFSVDIDVLNAAKIGYTGFEYNPMEALNYVSSLNLPLDKDPSKLTQLDIDTLNKSITDPYWAQYPDLYNPSGLALADIEISLDTITQSCKKHGLKFGIKLTGGGSYFGDVVEMSGLDYREKTATSGAALLNRIEQIVQNQ
jgi:hypothetical protein